MIIKKIINKYSQYHLGQILTHNIEGRIKYIKYIKKCDDIKIHTIVKPRFSSLHKKNKNILPGTLKRR